jgi:iron complex outermembrane receptor protein
LFNQKYTGVGQDRKWQANFKLYQPLVKDGDFIAVAGFYDHQVADFYDGVDFASYTTSGVNKNPATPVGNFKNLLSTPWNTDYSNTYTPPSSTSSNSSFQGVEQNPTNTGNLRGESRFTLLPNLKLTFDPSYQWVLANGEGTQTVKGTDPRLVGVGATSSKSNMPACYNSSGVVTGIDLDAAYTAAGAPICTDTVRLLSPSNTQTNRFTVNTSLIWDIIPGQLVQFAYAYDHGNVRQTGEYTTLESNGYPTSVFGGLQGWGVPILAADGSVLEKRNRLTLATLNQVSLEYIGKFFDNHLRLDLGARDPMFDRDLNQYCYTQPASNVYCTPYASVANTAGYLVAPFQIRTHYSKVLPNLGLTWNFDSRNSVFFDYSQALNAPINDDLYSIAVIGSGTTASAVGADNVQPETTTTYEVGYRFQTSNLKATFDYYILQDNNHIVSSFNQQTNDTLDQNVGSIDFWGLEGYVGYSPISHLNLIGSVAYEHSEDESNIPYSATLSLPTKGKQFFDTPPWTVAARATYDIGPFTFGMQTKYVAARYFTLVDDLQVPSYITGDADVRWRFDNLRKGAYLQLNVINIADTRYIGSYGNSPFTNNSASPAYSQLYAYQGPPRTVQVSLRLPF